MGTLHLIVQAYDIKQLLCYCAIETKGASRLWDGRKRCRGPLPLLPAGSDTTSLAGWSNEKQSKESGHIKQVPPALAICQCVFLVPCAFYFGLRRPPFPDSMSCIHSRGAGRSALALLLLLYHTRVYQEK